MRYFLVLMLIGSMFALDVFYPQPEADCQEILVLAPPEAPIVFEEDIPLQESTEVEVVDYSIDYEKRLSNLSLESIKDWQNVATVPPDRLP